MKIPEDLQPLYLMAKNHEAWIRSGYDHISDEGERVSMWDLATVIERIAVLTEQLEERDTTIRNINAHWKDAEAELAQARATAEYWKAEHLAGNKGIDTLRAQLSAMTADRNLWRDQHMGDCPAAAENEQLREQIETMGRPLTDEEWLESVAMTTATKEDVDAILAARARQQEQNKPQE